MGPPSSRSGSISYGSRPLILVFAVEMQCFAPGGALRDPKEVAADSAPKTQQIISWSAYLIRLDSNEKNAILFVLQSVLGA